MFLHIGNKKSIKTKDIIGIFDMDTATVSPITKEYLKTAERDKRTVSVSLELPKAFILKDDGTVYFSQISTSTLQGRNETVNQAKNK